MTERIKRLTELTLVGKMNPLTIETEFDRTDMFLSKQEMETKRLCEFLLNQKPLITEYSAFTGTFKFDDTIVGDAFNRTGHTETKKAIDHFYMKMMDNISTMEWQHATADYSIIIEKGFNGIKEEIDKALEIHNLPEEKEYLICLKKVADAMILWAHKCSAEAFKLSEKTTDPQYKNNLKKLSDTLLRVPENKPETFYEAVLCIYICYSMTRDSIGSIDRWLSPFYFADLENGNITKDEAKEYLQELFLMLQGMIPVKSKNFTRGGESHFCIGGYLKNGEDCFNDLSKLILEALTDLPTYIPQVTLRWTEKLSKEDFRYVLDLERKDPHKRIAFTNDEKRIRAYTQICGYSFENAVNYTTVGCNEPAFMGSIIASTSKGNVVLSIENTIFKRTAEIIVAKNFDEFYNIFEDELFKVIDTIFEYDDKYNLLRARDVNYISSLLFNGCIKSAKSLTQGGCDTAICAPMLIGGTNVVDSLAVIKQFVFDEKIISMKQLIDATDKNWEGYEDLRNLIIRKADFFGNDGDISNYVVQRYYKSLYNHLKGKKNVFGYPCLAGDLLGYHDHHKWFGKKTKATPDGRKSGEMIKFGFGQSEGKDREGLTALLNSIAKADPYGIACGSTVTNITLDEQLIKDDRNFEKTVDIFETYFKNGGVHFQLTYVSKEDLINAKQNPDNYQNLRVRVTGFADYFVKLSEGLQEDIIKRTTKKG